MRGHHRYNEALFSLCGNQNPKSTQESALWIYSCNATLSDGKASCPQETSHPLVSNVREILKDNVHNSCKRLSVVRCLTSRTAGFVGN